MARTKGQAVRYRRPIRRALGYIGNLATGFAGQMARNYRVRYRAPGSRTSTSQSVKRVEMAPLTGEKDVRMVYRKRRMNRGKKSSYLRRIRGFKSMQMKLDPCRISIFSGIQIVNSNANSSSYFGTFMGMCGNNAYSNHLGRVWEQMTVDTSSTRDKTRHNFLRVDHMSISIVLRNITNNIEAVSSNLVDIDVYKVVCIKDIPYARWGSPLAIESLHAALKAEMRQHRGMDNEVSDGGAGITTAQTNAGTSSANQVVGDLLFNAPPFLRYWKVIKMWKVHLPPGGTATFNFRDSKNYVIGRPQCISSEAGCLAAKKGLTKGYIFNINGRYVPVPVAAYEPTTVIMEHYTRYNCKPITPNHDTLVYQ